ncbi:MAG: nicotinate phosphoribosyltransferase [Gammaproteobacteria bacterium]|nr:MAG: nicotinate phosphoribosyltransferase [Gammaproteobacteria bacterium]
MRAGDDAIDRVDDWALFTDLYELTMLQAYHAEGLDGRAVFSLYFRTLPPQRNFMLACGQAEAIARLAALRFGPASLEALARLGFREDFLAALEGFRFEGEVRAVPEGTPVFPWEPILEIEAPLPAAQLAETLVMNRVHLQTTLASTAVRLRLAAGARTVVDFGMRRAMGADAAVTGVRAYWIAGLDATSNVLGGLRHGVPVTGTMAHSYIQAHADEASAFRAFAGLYPDSTLLIDTYAPLAAVDRVIALVREGFRVRAVRLDSGDLEALSRAVRERLDAAGLRQVRIIASGGLDEWRIAELVARGAPIDAFGVGSHLAAGAPGLDLCYKLVAYEGDGRFKASPGKAIYPGAKQVWRIGAGEEAMHDRLAPWGAPGEGAPLLRPVWRDGRWLVEDFADAGRARERAREAVAALPPRIRALEPAAPPYRVVIDPALIDAQNALRARIGQ